MNKRRRAEINDMEFLLTNWRIDWIEYYSWTIVFDFFVLINTNSVIFFEAMIYFLMTMKQ